MPSRAGNWTSTIGKRSLLVSWKAQTNLSALCLCLSTYLWPLIVNETKPKYMRASILTLFGLLCLTGLFAQHTVGLLSWKPVNSFEGYNLLYPHNQPNVYLLDNCGQIVHVWEDDPSWRPGNTAYLLPDGRLVKTKRPASVAGNPIWTGGGGAIVEIRDWDNNLLWSFEMNDSLRRLHHDIAVMPNGHILMIAWEAKTIDELIAAGMDTSLLVSNVLWSDAIFEVSPQLDSIVWEWHAWDHLVQDFDSTKANYGDVAAHPERIDLNYPAEVNSPSWLHTNSIDYDPINDLIIVSVPTFSEAWIIDHSTTIAEAAGHVGGLGGRGGDLMYRWGNPTTYRAGTPTDQQLFFQHDVHWIDEFVPTSHPFYGKVAAFNNRVGPDFSGAIVFTPPFDMYSWTFPMTGNVWGPAAPDWTFTYPGDSTRMYSTGLSSVQLLPNGNWLICSGRQGYSFEVTPDDSIVWEYVTPLKGGNPVPQGTELAPNDNLTFRIKRYPADYPAFSGKDLNPKGWLELEPDTNFCDHILPTAEASNLYRPKAYPNPSKGYVVLEWNAGMHVDVRIYDMFGRLQYQALDLSGGRTYLDTSDWLPGSYFATFNGMSPMKLLVLP